MDLWRTFHSRIIDILSHLLWAPMTETSPHWLEPLERGKALVNNKAT